jgi:hypothetical protein
MRPARSALLLAALLAGCSETVAPVAACHPGTIVRGYNIVRVSVACDSTVIGTIAYPPRPIPT